MDLGLLIAATRSLADTITQYRSCIEDIEPDYIWLSDRLLVDDLTNYRRYIGDQTIDPPSEFLDPFISLAAFAASCRENPQLGIAVTDFYRRSPPDLIRASNTLGQLIGTPLNLGFGAGEAINLKPLGYANGPKPVSFLEENLRIFCGINETGIYSNDQGPPVTLGYSEPRTNIWIGGQRDRMLKIAARYGDGWLPAWKMSPEEYRAKIVAIMQLASQFGRPAPRMGMFALAIIGESRKQLLASFRENPFVKMAALQASGETWKKWGLNHPCGEGSKGFFDVMLGDVPGELLHEALQSVPIEMLSETVFLGSEQEVLEELWRYREAGMQHLTLMYPFFANNQVAFGVPDFYPQLRNICREVKGW
jgi:phthiodiolone/phenolphthiodiolone dimycocerosates ketoreductase